jgi:hypothetical protein
VEVKAASSREAAEKGYRKWRREHAFGDVTYVEEQPSAREKEQENE